MKILLTGGEGMLAKDFLSVLDEFPEFECHVPPRKELPQNPKTPVGGELLKKRKG